MVHYHNPRPPQQRCNDALRRHCVEPSQKTAALLIAYQWIIFYHIFSSPCRSSVYAQLVVANSFCPTLWTRLTLGPRPFFETTQVSTGWHYSSIPWRGWCHLRHNTYVITSYSSHYLWWVLGVGAKLSERGVKMFLYVKLELSICNVRCAKVEYKKTPCFSSKPKGAYFVLVAG